MNADHLDYIAQQAKKRGYTNVEVIHAQYDDPLLPQSGVALLFTCNTYHHLENRVDYFKSAARYLRSHGRVAIIDLGGKNWLFRLFGHWTPKETSRNEMEAAGYRLTHDFEFLARQNFQVFALSHRETP